MTILLCLLAAIALFTVTVLASREVIGKSPLRIDLALHALSLFAIAIALSTRGLWYHAKSYLVDIWVAQDSLLKTAQGLRSSLDHFNPIGPLQQWVYGLTLLVQSPATSSLILGNVVIAVFALGLAIVLLRHRASPLTIGIVGLIAVTTALSPRDIDTLMPAADSSMLAPYNRWGWALLVPLTMRGALPFRRADRLGAVLAGIAIALLLLLKVTYGLAAIGVLAVGLVLQPSRWRETGLIAAACLLSLVLIELLTGGQVAAYLADLAQTMKMASSGFRAQKFVAQLPAFAAFALFSLIVLLAATHRNDEPATHALLDHWRAYLMALAVGGGGMVVLMQNHYYTEAVTLLLMPLIIAEWTGLMAITPGQPGAVWQRGGEWIGLILLVTLALPAIDTGFIAAQKVQTERLAPSPEYAGTPMHDLVVDKSYLPAGPGACGSPTCSDVRRMSTGRDLLQQKCPTWRTRSVLAFNFANPFPFLMGSPSPRHAPIWLHADRSFSASHHVAPDKLFAGVGCVIVANGESNAVALMEIYGADLQSAFTPAGENAEWQLWVRK